MQLGLICQHFENILSIGSEEYWPVVFFSCNVVRSVTSSSILWKNLSRISIISKHLGKFYNKHIWVWSFLEYSVQFSSVQSLSCVQLCSPWTAASQASLSITNSQNLLKLMSTESVMPSNQLILCRPLLLPPLIFPSTRSFQMSQFFSSGGQSIGVSASASVIPMNAQDWILLG